MKLKIEIELDGAAFVPGSDDPAPHDVANAAADEAGRILEKYVERIRFGGGFDTPGELHPLRDTNGNRCGFAKVEE